MISNSSSPVQDWSCVDQDCTGQGEVYLNASALYSNERSLRLYLTTEIPYDDPDSSLNFNEQQVTLFKILTLLDSGSTDCFIDTTYVEKNAIPTTPIPSVNLRLFDGSLARKPISSIASLPIRFPSGELLDIDFYVTPLDSSCKAVLGYNFLHRYNLLVDWLIGKISFQKHTNSEDISQTSQIENFATPNIDNSLEDSAIPKASSTFAANSPNNPKSRHPRFKNLQEKFPFEPIYTYPSVSQMSSKIKDPDKVDIALIGAAAFHRVCKESGIEPVLIRAVHSELTARWTATDAPCAPDSKSSVPHPSIPTDYHDFADVFDKVKADTLAEHRPYDLKIEMEPGTEPPLG